MEASLYIKFLEGLQKAVIAIIPLLTLCADHPDEIIDIIHPDQMDELFTIFDKWKTVLIKMQSDQKFKAQLR